ncbi:MAG: hypothetical protein M3046_02475 [Actinomycetota bacterium]|nr:hypothetical protein [Actinomycetota bacterium]
MKEDVRALADDELTQRYSVALQLLPGIKADPMVRQRAWDDVRRYEDEVARRYPPSIAPL